MTLVETYFELPHTVGFTFSTLGTDFVAQVEGTQVTIQLPQTERGPNWPLLGPPAFVNVFNDNGFSNVLKRVTWGSETGTSGDPPKTKAAWVSAVGLSTEVAPGAEQDGADKLVAAMGAWWPRVCDWIEVMTRQIHSPPGKTLILGPHHPVWVEDGDHVKRLYRSTPVSLVVPRSSGPDAAIALTKTGFEAALLRAANGAPQVEWLLIRDARLAHTHGSRRIALIDAGTAAELAIAKLIRDRVQGIPANIEEQLLAGHRMLYASSKLLKRLGGKLPDNLQQLLIEPRNKAAHLGTVPSPKECHDALIIATEIVESAYPI